MYVRSCIKKSQEALTIDSHNSYLRFISTAMYLMSNWWEQTSLMLVAAMDVLDNSLSQPLSSNRCFTLANNSATP
jgi:hypothetical protein